MSNYILIHTHHTYNQVENNNQYVRGHRYERGKDDVSLKFLDSLDDFYHYVLEQFECPEDESDTEAEEFDIIDYINDDMVSFGLDQSFTLFKNGKENPIFSIAEGDTVTFGEFENFCFGVTKSKPVQEIKRYSEFTNESKKEKFPNVKKLLIDEFVVILGRDAKSNDHLTFIMADDEDIWMHVKGVPGSHVVIKVKDKLPTDPIIKQAAAIAKKNSKADPTEKATVVYCKRRFVNKEKTMNPGQVKVDYKNAYEIEI